MLYFVTMFSQFEFHHRLSLTIVTSIFASLTCSMIVPLSLSLDTNWYFFVKLTNMTLV